MVIDKQINSPDYIDGINRLAFKILQQDKQVFCFSSLNDQEGKTTTVHHTAEALVMMHKKVCVIDVDMLQKKEGSPEDNLNAYLENKISIDRIVSQRNNVDFVHSSISQNSVTLLTSPSFKQLLKEFKKKYDYVLLDAPSLNPNVDALILAKESDFLILVIEEGRSRREELVQLLLALRRNSINLLGSVLNKIHA